MYIILTPTILPCLRPLPGHLPHCLQFLFSHWIEPPRFPKGTATSPSWSVLSALFLPLSHLIHSLSIAPHSAEEHIMSYHVQQLTPLEVHQILLHGCDVFLALPDLLVSQFTLTLRFDTTLSHSLGAPKNSN